MSIVTLTTEWINDDFYAGAVKGAILSKCPEANIVVVTNQIPQNNIAFAAFILKNAYSYYPKGTIHLIGVKSDASSSTPHIVVLNNGHYFIGADNGILGLMFPENVEKIIGIEPGEHITTFPELTVFADIASYIMKGGDVDQLGEPRLSLNSKTSIMATIESSVITGSVIYIDSYNNAITNISKDLFEQVGKGKAFEVQLKNSFTKVTKINQSYSETVDGEILVLFNSLNLLEIALKNGNASEMLSLEINSHIRIKFK